MDDISLEVISGAEYDGLVELYHPLASAVRDLIAASIRTGADEETVRNATTAIRAVTASLAGGEPERRIVLRHAETGSPLPVGSPVVGVRNAIAPPIEVVHAGGRCSSEFELGVAYEGPPGLVHGGVSALIMDHILGEAASDALTKMMFTGTITLKYLRGTPLGRLRADSWIDRSDGVKTVARGTLSDADGVTVEAEGVFITPAWAREAG